MRTKKRIVHVVDDDDDVRDSLRAVLESAGFEVRAFASGHEFLEEFDSSLAICIILDLHMPDISGLQVLDILRARQNRVPVVLFTGRAHPATDELLKQSRIAALLAKPVDNNELIDLIQRLATDRTAKIEFGGVSAACLPRSQDRLIW